MVNIDNLQAILTRGSAKPLASALLFQIVAADAARRFLWDWIEKVPAGKAAESADVPAIYLLFTWTGIEKLLAGHPGLDVQKGRKEMERFFTDPGQAPDGAEAVQFGFAGDSDPAGWWDGKFKSSDIDLALHMCFDSATQQADWLQRLRQAAAGQGLREHRLTSFPDGALSGFRPPDGRLHFGYRDGVSKFDVDWQDEGLPGAVNFREFLVGFSPDPGEANSAAKDDGYATMPIRSGPWKDFAREGSFAALTWIRQDVAGFNTFLKDNAAKAPPQIRPEHGEEWVAAKLMGRWRDGTSLSKCPFAPPAAPDLSNTFGYRDDPRGELVPLTSHIRVANLRDQALKPADAVKFPSGPPRFIRRGFSYGPPLAGVQDDGLQRGVVGTFFFARVNEQFYSILRWMQKTDFSEVFGTIPNGRNAQDALIGNRGLPKANANFQFPIGAGATQTLALKNFVAYKGIVILFAPSLSALRTLAGA
jgi:deferrochelatase/peroxidase EfeB